MNVEELRIHVESQIKSFLCVELDLRRYICHYELSRACHNLDGHGDNAEKIYYINKILHGVDIFYEVDLPHIWYAEHPVGTILGRASYGDYFFVYQGCTVGGNKGKYPVIGTNVTMFSNSKILGASHIGDNVVIGANTYIKNDDIPSNSLVFGQYPNLVIKERDPMELKEMITAWLD